VNTRNLTFNGEILPRKGSTVVKLAFGKMFFIDDTDWLERCFFRDTIVMRRNLKRKEASQYFHTMQGMRTAATLVNISTGAQTDTDADRPQLATQEGGKIKAAILEQQRTTADAAPLNQHTHLLGKPNLFARRPFRNSDNVRNRSAQAGLHIMPGTWPEATGRLHKFSPVDQNPCKADQRCYGE
jgi:hypothetical protein